MVALVGMVSPMGMRVVASQGYGGTHGNNGGGTSRTGVTHEVMEVASQGPGGTSGDGGTHGTVDMAPLGVVVAPLRMVAPMGMRVGAPLGMVAPMGQWRWHLWGLWHPWGRWRWHLRVVVAALGMVAPMG